MLQIRSNQISRSVVSDSLRPHEPQHARPPCPSPTPRLHSDSHPSSQWCHPAISSSVVPFSSCPQSLPASVFSNESTLHMRWPKHWSFSFSIIPSKEIPGLISFRMDWLDLLAVQGTLRSLLQHHSSKASILRRSAFFTVQLSCKTIPNMFSMNLLNEYMVQCSWENLSYQLRWKNDLASLIIPLKWLWPLKSRLFFLWLQNKKIFIG